MTREIQPLREGSIEAAKSVITGMVRGVAFLHDHGVIHRDPNPPT